MRVAELGGKPIEQHSSPNVGGSMTAHQGVVLHIAEGSYEGTIAWQMNPDQRYASGGTVTTSSTWIVGKNVGEWAQMADSDRVAWCQRAGSYTWHSIELAGHAPDAPSAWQIEACAQILAWEHLTYGVPVQATSSTSGAGLGHHSMDNDTSVEWGHDDCPGAGVIAAKPAIVARAQEIINGGDTMSAQDVADAFEAGGERAANDIGRGMDTGFDGMVGRLFRNNGYVTALAADVAEAKAGVAALHTELAQLGAVQVDYDKLADAIVRRVLIPPAP